MEEETTSEFNAYFKDFTLYIDAFEIPIGGEFEYTIIIPKLYGGNGGYTLSTTEEIKTANIDFSIKVPDIELDLHYPFYFIFLIILLHFLRVVKLWIF